jgi:hypothetical protein
LGPRVLTCHIGTGCCGGGRGSGRCYCTPRGHCKPAAEHTHQHARTRENQRSGMVQGWGFWEMGGGGGGAGASRQAGWWGRQAGWQWLHTVLQQCPAIEVPLKSTGCPHGIPLHGSRVVWLHPQRLHACSEHAQSARTVGGACGSVEPCPGPVLQRWQAAGRRGARGETATPGSHWVLRLGTGMHHTSATTRGRFSRHTPCLPRGGVVRL